MSKDSENEILAVIDRRIGTFRSKLHLNFEEFLLEMMPEVESGEFHDAKELQSIVIEDVLNPCRERTSIEELLWIAAIGLCDDFMVPEETCAPLIVMIILSLSKGNVNECKAMTDVLMSYSAYRTSFEKAPSRIGAMGGRPVHPRKQEAMGLARIRWEQIPYAKLNSVASYVKSKLEEKYTDAPKLPSIKSWLKEADFRPQ